MKSRIWTYTDATKDITKIVYGCKFCYIRWQKTQYTKVYKDSWNEHNYEKISANEKYCAVGGLMNIVKIKARIQYIGE